MCPAPVADAPVLEALVDEVPFRETPDPVGRRSTATAPSEPTLCEPVAITDPSGFGVWASARISVRRTASRRAVAFSDKSSPMYFPTTVSPEGLAAGTASSSAMAHLFRRRKAALDVLFEGFHHDGFQRRRIVGDEARRPRRRALARDGVQNAGVVVMFEGVPAGGERVEHDADGEQVRPPIHGRSEHLLGGHVGELSLHFAGYGGDGLLLRRLGDAEVEEFRRAGVRHEHVVRRHVAVNDAERSAGRIAELVRGVQTTKRLTDEVRSDAERQPTPLFRLRDHVSQGLAVHPFHHEVERPVVFAELERVHHVRVVNERRDARLFEHHALEASGLLGRGEQRLHGDELVKTPGPLQPTEPNLPHSATGDACEQLVAPERSSRNRRVCVGHSKQIRIRGGRIHW